MTSPAILKRLAALEALDLDLKPARAVIFQCAGAAPTLEEQRAAAKLRGDAEILVMRCVVDAS